MDVAGKGKRECSTCAGFPSKKCPPLDETESISVSSALGTTGFLGAMLRAVLALHTIYRLRDQIAWPTVSSVCIGRDVSPMNSSWAIKPLVSKMWLLHCSVGNTLYWSGFSTKELVKCLMTCLKAKCLVPVDPPTLDRNALYSQKVRSAYDGWTQSIAALSKTFWVCVFLWFYEKIMSSFFKWNLCFGCSMLCNKAENIFFWVSCLSFLLVSILLLIPVKILKL